MKSIKILEGEWVSDKQIFANGKGIYVAQIISNNIITKHKKFWSFQDKDVAAMLLLYYTYKLFVLLSINVETIIDIQVTAYKS